MSQEECPDISDERECTTVTIKGIFSKLFNIFGQ